MTQDFHECPACGAGTTRPILRLDLPFGRGDRLDARIFNCSSCSHHFLPLTSDEQRRVDTKYGDDYVGYRDDPFFAARIREELAQRLTPRVPLPTRVLDVGCGAGEFMRAATAAGYDVEGVDISKAAAEHCRSTGLRARAGDFLTMPFSGPYGMITMWDVVEHLRAPAAFLRRARELLSPGGLLVLKIPGYGPLSYRALGMRPQLARALLNAPGHQQYFTHRSLEALLARCGFEGTERLGTRRFRSKRPTRSLKKKVSRLVVRTVNLAAGNANLYVAARAAAPAPVGARADADRVA